MVEPVVAGTGEITMKRILNYLATNGAFLYEDDGCIITHSEYIDSFGGTGSVTLCGDSIQLRLWLERDRLFLDVRGIDRAKWFSMDIITELLSGRVPETGEMNEQNTTLLREQFAQIEQRFSPTEIELTEKECCRLEKKRAKEMFG